MRAAAPSRSERERGAALVEFALLGPVLVALALGVMEFGFAWRDAQQVTRAVQSAGRTVSNEADSRLADYQGLQALASGLGNLDRGEIEKVVIYKSTTASGQVPAACENFDTSGSAPYGVANSCNVYTPAQLATSDPVGFPDDGSRGCAAGSWDIRWCPASRNRDPSATVDYVGVWVRVRYERFTGLIPGDLLIERSAVFQLEPPTASD